jgi:hypothetical protein
VKNSEQWSARRADQRRETEQRGHATGAPRDAAVNNAAPLTHMDAMLPVSNRRVSKQCAPYTKPTEQKNDCCGHIQSCEAELEDCTMKRILPQSPEYMSTSSLLPNTLSLWFKVASIPPNSAYTNRNYCHKRENRSSCLRFDVTYPISNPPLQTNPSHLQIMSHHSNPNHNKKTHRLKILRALANPANLTSRNLPETPQIDQKKNAAPHHRILNHNLLQYTTTLPNSD